MIKKKVIFLLVGVILCLSGWESVLAFQQTKKGIEKGYYDLGFKAIPDAVDDAEAYFKTSIVLPKKIPPLIFTHSFGRFSAGGNQNDGLEVVYLNEKKHFNYIINVRPAKYGIKLNPNTDSKITLTDGTHAYYDTVGKNGRLIVLVFEKHGWAYMLSIQKDLLNKPITTLVQIANSL